MGRRRATPPATRSSLAVSLARLRLRRPMRFGVGAGAGVGTEAGAAGAGAGVGARLASLRSVAQRRAVGNETTRATDELSSRRAQPRRREIKIKSAHSAVAYLRRVCVRRRAVTTAVRAR